jgi:hypothetical protein
MRIYHTSNLVVSEPDVYHSRHHLDFGDGMYLTPLEKQARDYGQRFIRRGEPAIMNIYEFADEITDVNRKVFPAYDGEWLDYVAACRKGYARIVKMFAEQTGLTYEQALDFFYNSKTFELISEGVADMHCLSDEYLAEELIIERNKQL